MKTGTKAGEPAGFVPARTAGSLLRLEFQGPFCLEFCCRLLNLLSFLFQDRIQWHGRGLESASKTPRWCKQGLQRCINVARTIINSIPELSVRQRTMQHVVRIAHSERLWCQQMLLTPTKTNRFRYYISYRNSNISRTIRDTEMTSQHHTW